MPTTLTGQTPVRDAYYDNLRAFLILCVVTGHLLETVLTHSPSAQTAYKWIYSFHMPAFLFVSGLFSKSYFRDGHLKKDRLLSFFLIYVIFQSLFALFDLWVLGKPVWFSFFSPRTGLWYLLALMMYLLLVPVFDHQHPAVAIGLFFAFGLLVGLDKDADTYMTFSRFCTMGIFFWAGFYLNPKKLRNIRSKRFSPYVGWSILALSVVLMIFLSWFFPYALFTGKTAYAQMKVDWWLGMLLRLIWYALAGVMIFALLCVTPTKKHFYTVVGTRTLQIYLFQVLIYNTVVQYRYFGLIPLDSFWVTLLVIGAGILVTTLLSLRLFGYPVEGLQKLGSLLDRVLIYPRQRVSEPQSK